MDDKTEELREIFIDATGEDTVTESQEETPGSLADDPEADEDRLRELVAECVDDDARTDLDLDAYEAVVRGFHDGDDDGEIAADLGVDEATVFDARLDCHLVRDTDRDAPFDLSELRSLLVEDVSVEECAGRLDADPDTVAHYAAVARADIASTRANDRFRDGFAELLSDADLETRLASDAREDGLQEATEDMETDVEF